MKKPALITLGIFVFIYVVLIIALPWKPTMVCFGDVCPANGGLYLVYRKPHSEAECIARGAYPLVGYGWGRTYRGCSPHDAHLVAGSKVPRPLMLVLELVTLPF